MTQQPLNPNGRVIGVLAAIEDELLPTVRRLALERDGRWWRGRVGAHEVAAGLTGVGGQRAVETLASLMADAPLGSLYNIGFVGALTERFIPGEVVVFRQLISRGGAGAPLALPDDAFDATSPGAGAPTLLSSDVIVSTPGQKRELHARTGAGAVDMESYPLAAEAIRRGLRVCVLRAVSDGVDMTLPAALPTFVHADGRRNTARATMYLATHPWVVPAVLKIAGHSSRAAKATAEHLARRLGAPG